jgi:hypothetical protein
MWSLQPRYKHQYLLAFALGVNDKVVTFRVFL